MVVGLRTLGRWCWNKIGFQDRKLSWYVATLIYMSILRPNVEMRFLKNLEIPKSFAITVMA